MKFDKSISILYTSDIRASIDYFMDKAGFEQKWEWEDPPTFAGISRDEVELFSCKDGRGQPGTWLSIVVDDVDAYYASIKEKGAKIASPPKSCEWDMREMLVKAPDGHMIRFGQNIACD